MIRRALIPLLLLTFIVSAQEQLSPEIQQLQKSAQTKLRARDLKGALEDFEKIFDVIDRIEGTTICALAEAFCWPLRSFVQKYREEFESFIAEKAAV